MSTSVDRLPDWLNRSNEKASSEKASSEKSSSTTGGGKMETEPIVVWEAANQMEAEIVKGRLESEGIPALIRGDATATIFGLTAGNLARTEVLVPEPLAERALTILAEDVTEVEELADVAELEADESDVRRDDETAA
jgi:hypothetical protein